MSNFLKYMRLFALGITFSSSMALPYVQIKFYDVFREATQASNNELGLLMTIFTAVSMALYIPGGVLADRGSPKKLLLLSLIMMCGLNAYFAFHTSYGAAQLIWALLAIAANTVQWPTLIKAIRDTGSSEEQGRMFGTFYGTTGIFSSIIGFVGAWIYSNGSSNIEGFHLMLLGQSAFCAVAAVAVGFFGAAFFAEHRDVASLVEQNHERVFIVLSGLLFNPWIAGILMSAILAAVMSTLSCQLLVCSSTLTEDFYRTFIRRNASQRELVWFGRSMVLLVSVVAVWLARDPNSLVLSLVSYAWAGFGAAFGPVIIMSLWWRRMTRNGALAGMITGAVTVLVWNHYAWLGLYEILPGFVFALIAIVVVSLLDKAPSKSIAKTFDEVQAAVRNPA